MKNSILDKLFDGLIHPAEYIKCTDPDYRETYDEINEITDSLMKSISEEDRQKFLRIDELRNYKESLYDYDYFTGGFSLGIKIILEALGCKLTVPDVKP